MTELIITPDHESIVVPVPEKYIGKKVKITIEETQTSSPLIEKQPDQKKPSQFKKILSDELVEQYHKHIKKSRAGWTNRI